MHETRRPGRIKFFLDFDGVLQAPNASEHWSRTRTRRVTYRNTDGTRHPGFVITWAPELVTRLEELIDEFDLELLYLTTWLYPESALTSFLATIGGLRGGHALRMPQREDGLYLPWQWKIQEIHRVRTAEPGPVIWIDDIDARTFGYEISENELGHPGLVLAPDSETGLTRDHLDQIRTFCQDVSTRQQAAGGQEA